MKFNDDEYQKTKNIYNDQISFEDVKFKETYPNENNNDLSKAASVVKKENDNISQTKRVIIFLIGWAGLQILAVILSLFFLGAFIEQICTQLGRGNAADGVWMFAIYFITLSISVAVLGKSIITHEFSTFKNSKAIKAGITIGIIMILAQSLYSIIISKFITITDNDNESSINTMIEGAPIFSSLCIIVLAPLLEELTYRFALFGFIKKYNKILAYVFTVIIFASIHFSYSSDTATLINELLNMPSYIIAACFLTYAYDKYGFAGSVSAHAFNNFISVLSTILLLLLN